MPYIYKYVNRAEEKHRYVGIVRNDERLLPRFIEHEKREGWAFPDYEISVMHVKTVYEAEALEAHFIALYANDGLYNKQKVDWGLCPFIVGTLPPWVTLEELDDFMLQAGHELNMLYSSPFWRDSKTRNIIGVEGGLPLVLCDMKECIDDARAKDNPFP